MKSLVAFVVGIHARFETLRQMIRFGIVGTGGFIVDSSVLYALHELLGVDLYSGRLMSWLVAVTFTWAMNRRFTFADTRPPFRQWLAYVAGCSLGGAVNYSVYSALVTFVPLVAEVPILGVAAGGISGAFFNFTISKVVIFRRARHTATESSGEA